MSICKMGHLYTNEKIKKEYIIREYKKTDYKQVIKIWKLTNLLDNIYNDTNELIEITLKHGGIFYVIEHCNKIVGTSWLTTDYREIYLHRFAIHPDFQGKRLSISLMNETMKYVRELNLPLRLEVQKENTIARNVYEKYKFEIFDDYLVLMIHKKSLLSDKIS